MKGMSQFTRLAVLFSLLLMSCKPAEVTQNKPDITHQEGIQEEVARLIVNMPADDKEEEIWVNEQLVNLGNGAVNALSGMLIDPAVGSDLQARYALSSLANYVAGPDLESERDKFETGIITELQKDYPLDVQSFLMEQLRVIASDASVPVLESFLMHKKLHNYALRVLLTIDTPAALNSIRRNLPESEGQHQVAIIKALGELKDMESAGQLRELTFSEEWPLTRMSLFALSNIGQPDASSLFEEAIERYDGFRQSEVISFYLNYADALLDEGYAVASDMITEFFLNGTYPDHIKSSALHTQFRSRGADMLQKLTEIAQSSENILATPALNLANRLEGNQVTGKLTEALEETSAVSNKIYFIEALGNRGDISAVSVLRSYTDHSYGDIRVSALNALHNLQGEVSPMLALTVLNRAEEDRHVQEIKNLFLQLEPEESVPVAAASLANASLKAKPVLIELLKTYRATDHKSVIVNELNSGDKQVRMAVWNFLGETGEASDAGRLFNHLDGDLSSDEVQSLLQAFASVLNRTDTDTDRSRAFQDFYNDGSDLQKERLLHAIPGINKINTSAVLETSLNSSTATVRSSAAEVLTTLHHPDILPLISLAVKTAPENYKPALIANFSRIVTRSESSPEEKEMQVHELFSSISEVHYKIQLLEQTAAHSEIFGLQTVSRYLNHENTDIQEASVSLTAQLLEPHYSEDADMVNVAIGVLAVLDEETAGKVKNELLKRLEEQKGEDEEETEESRPVFGTLFNGRNLDGWQVRGTADTWGVEDGILYTDGDGSGWLSTENEYDDFVIELEYRVPEGGNSGLFIRAPKEGNPAYEGLEIQILDDYADQYAQLEPWQYTGSIYFEQAPSNRVTKPSGEWQSMKVRALGPEIEVILNGELIVNTTLINYMQNVPSHPGLLQRSGFIGLQNHGDRVDFKNIRIRKLN